MLTELFNNSSPQTSLRRMLRWYNYMETRAVPYKVKHIPSQVLGMNSTEMKTYVHQNTWMRMCIVTFVKKVKTEKNPALPINKNMNKQIIVHLYNQKETISIYIQHGWIIPTFCCVKRRHKPKKKYKCMISCINIWSIRTSKTNL